MAPVFGVAFLLPAGGLFSRVVAFSPPAVAEGAVAFAGGGGGPLWVGGFRPPVGAWFVRLPQVPSTNTQSTNTQSTNTQSTNTQVGYRILEESRIYSVDTISQ